MRNALWWSTGTSMPENVSHYNHVIYSISTEAEVLSRGTGAV